MKEEQEEVRANVWKSSGLRVYSGLKATNKEFLFSKHRVLEV
jgi:hypothetical protein